MLAVAIGLLGMAACGDSAPRARPIAPGRELAPDEVRAVVAAYERAWNTRDRALYVSLFASAGTVEDPVGSPPVRGPEALGDFFDGIVAGANLRLEIRPADLRISGNHVAFPFAIHLEVGGGRFLLSPVDTMDLDGEGRITALRAFYSPSDLRPEP